VYLTGPAGFAFEPAEPDSRIEIEPKAVRAGETATLRAVGRQVAVIGWDVPQGWPQPRKSADQAWELVVPESTLAYQYDIQALLEVGGKPLRLPLRIAVAPAVIRL